jgi:hypothetical protein
VQAQLRAIVRPEQFGAVGNNTTDDTAAFTAACTYLTSIGGGTLELGPKYYRIRDWVVPSFVYVQGCGDATHLMFAPSGNDANDATSYVVRWEGSVSTLDSFRIEGRNSANTAYLYGNGLLITSDARGYQRSMKSLKIFGFAGYKASVIGGTYGVNRNYARADITDDTGGHLLTGGNGLVAPTGSSQWEMKIDGLQILYMDGIGVNFEFITDSKLTNIYIGSCAWRGLVLRGANNEWDKVKVYLCNRLNVMDDFATTVSKVIPHQSTLAYDFGAVQLAGQNNVGRMEVQENGSLGIYLGNPNTQFRGGMLDALVDGNGGFDLTVSPTVAAEYRRPGMLLINYYETDLRIVSEDLRSKDGYPRQSKALQTIVGKFSYSSLGTIAAGNFYRVKDNSGGADFIPLQLNYATTSNAVGFAFQARRLYPAPLDPATNFGTGSLEVPNGNSLISIVVQNQYDKDQNIDGGYAITGDYGDSIVTVNGQIVKNGTGTWDGALTQLGAYNLWVDATGDLRIKSGVPTSDTDGTVVGTQT